MWPVGAPVPGYQGRDQIVDAFATGKTPRAIGIDVSTFSATPGRVVVDGNTAVVELSVTAATVDGSPYENDYAFFYQLSVSIPLWPAVGPDVDHVDHHGSGIVGPRVQANQ